MIRLYAYGFTIFAAGLYVFSHMDGLRPQLIGLGLMLYAALGFTTDLAVLSLSRGLDLLLKETLKNLDELKEQVRNARHGSGQV